MKTFSITSSSPEETQALGSQLASAVHEGDVLIFNGGLGAGKTTFVQGMTGHYLSDSEAVSPTFVLSQTYHGEKTIHHLDFYRLTKKEILDIGISDYLNGSGEIEAGVVLIEWGERCKEIWPRERIEIKIHRPKDKSKRMFSFKAIGQHLEKDLISFQKRAQKL